MNPAVSIVIPTYNRAHQLGRVLGALKSQDTAAGAFEVIAIDDGSTDSTADVLAAPAPYAMRSLRCDHGGPAAARNAGIAEATGDLILFIDDDVIPHRDLVRRHIDAQARTPGVVIGRLVCPGATKQPVWAEWETRTLEKQYDAMLAGKWVPTPRQFYTANASVAREAALRAGLFDASFKRAEDVEFAYRLHDLGLRFSFDPEAQVIHDTPRTLAGWMRMSEQYGDYDVIMWRDKGRGHIVRDMAREYHYDRKRVMKSAGRAFAGRALPMSILRTVAPALIGGADLVGRRGGMAACSAVFNVSYWDAVCRGVGGRQKFWSMIDAEIRAELSMAEATE